MFIVFLGGVVVSDPPLTSVQMLWVNLIMDTFAALALATEPPSDDLLKQPPYSRTELIVTPVMWRNIVGQSIFQAGTLIVFLFWGQQIFGLEYPENEPFWYRNSTTGEVIASKKTEHYTLMFNTFVFMQVFNEINARKLGPNEYNVFKGFFNNFMFLFIIILTTVVQIVLVQYGGVPVRVAALSMEQHIICILIGMFSIIQGFLVKALLPVSWFNKLHMKEEVMTDEEEKEAFTTQFRKSFRASHKKASNIYTDNSK